jgi:ribonuclease HI
MKKIVLTTDGACIGNPGPGGWACVLRFHDWIGELYGHERHTTNNRMELRAVIEGLRALKEPCEITLNTDSQYVKDGTTKWLPAWKENGWVRKGHKAAGSKPVLNQELWMELDRAVQRHHIAWHWVRGHAEHADNIRCDSLANEAARRQISSDGIQRVKGRGERLS